MSHPRPTLRPVLISEAAAAETTSGVRRDNRPKSSQFAASIREGRLVNLILLEPMRATPARLSLAPAASRTECHRLRYHNELLLPPLPILRTLDQSPIGLAYLGRQNARMFFNWCTTCKQPTLIQTSADVSTKW